MLDKSVCEKCSPDYVQDTGIVYCPKTKTGRWRSFGMSLPPKDCPYKFEHAVAHTSLEKELERKA